MRTRLYAVATRYAATCVNSRPMNRVRRKPPSVSGVLGHVRCNVAGAQVRHALTRVIALVAGQRLWTKASLARLVNEVGHDLAFGSTCRLVDLKVHQQSVTVLHQRMRGVRQVRLLAFALLGQPCLGIGRALMRCIRAALAVEVNRRIVRIIRWLVRGRLIFRLETLQTGGSFDQRAVNREVLTAQQPTSVRLLNDRIEELLGDLVLQQSLAVLRERRTIKYWLNQVHTQEPAIQELI